MLWDSMRREAVWYTREGLRLSPLIFVDTVTRLGVELVMYFSKFTNPVNLQF